METSLLLLIGFTILIIVYMYNENHQREHLDDRRNKIGCGYQSSPCCNVGLQSFGTMYNPCYGDFGGILYDPFDNKVFKRQ